jgi:RNA polymerase sigma-70 factor (ECF subfamily)
MAGSRAIGELYDAAYPRLVLQLFAICGDQVDAEDAVQEAFVKALAAGAAFDRVDNPEAWLRKVALNHQRNVWRRTGVARRFLTRVPGPRQVAELDPDHVAVMDALARLDLDHRTVLVLHHLADLGTAEIARELGIPEGTVKSRLARGRTRIAPLLDDREEHDHA